MHVLGVRGIHCPCHLRGKAQHRDKQPHAATTANRNIGTHHMGKRFLLYPFLTVLCLSLSFSLHSCSLLRLAYKRESRGPFLYRLWLLFTSSFSSREELSISLFLLLQPWARLGSHPTETWGQTPSLTLLYPLLEISANNTAVWTGHRVLLFEGPN
jgi:hypothetical protein